jgi:hypothetical protein
LYGKTRPISKLCATATTKPTMKNLKKMTENQTITNLIYSLENDGWFIESRCLNQERGTDVVARKKNKYLYIEAKGARANDNSKNKKRKYFNKGQIKTHFGVALIKIMELMQQDKKANYAIAQPNDEEIHNAIGHLLPYLKKLGIKHFWVNEDKTIIEQ